MKYYYLYGLTLGLLLSREGVTGAAQKWYDRAVELNYADDSDGCKKAYNEVLSNFSSRTVDFFRTLDARGAAYLFAKITGYADLDAYDRGERDGGTGLARIGKNFRKQDYEEMSDDVCQVFAHGLEHLTESGNMKQTCRHEYLRLLEDRAVRISTVAGLTPKWIQEDGQRVARALIGNDRDDIGKVLKKLPIDTYKVLIRSEDSQSRSNCNLFDANVFLRHLTKEQRQKMTASCLAAMQGLDAADIKHMEEFPDDVFNLYNGGLSEATSKRLTASKLTSFASKLDDDKPCKNLHLSNISAGAMSGLTNNCLRGFLSSNQGVVIGKGLANASLAAFKGQNDNYSILKKLAVADYKYLSLEFIQKVINSSDGLRNLQSDESNGAILNPTVVKGLRLNKDQFKTLAEQSPSIAGQVLAQAEELPENVLTLCEAETIKSLIIERRSELLVGFAALKSLENSRKGFNKIIAIMGDEANAHICSTITTLADYLDLDWLRPYAGPTCIKNLSFSIDKEDLKKAPELAGGHESIWHNMIQDLKPKEWRNVEVGLFAVFAKRAPGFCREFAKPQHSEAFNFLKDSHLHHIGGECARELRDRIKKENVAKFSENVFSQFRREDWNLALKDVTDTQLPLISEDLVDAELAKHVFSGINKKELAELGESKFLLLSSKQLGALTPDASQVITFQLLPKISARNLMRISDAQLNSWSSDVILALTPDQIRVLGADVKASLEAVSKLKDRLTEEQRVALEFRLKGATGLIQAKPDKETSSGGLSTMTIVGIVMGSIFGVILIACGVFFLVIKPRQTPTL